MFLMVLVVVAGVVGGVGGCCAGAGCGIERRS